MTALVEVVPSRWRTVRKTLTHEPTREPLANIVIMPGAPSAQCPACMFCFKGGSFAYWPAIERRGDRWVFGCERGHRWFADVA